MNYTYMASKVLAGEGELLRQHAFTRGMSRDLMQAAADFCRNLGLMPIYAECSAEGLTRYLFWGFPPGVLMEVRSGRTKEQFEKFDRAIWDRDKRLLSLHINERELYSAVWISAEHFETGKAFLAAHGITTAERREG